MEKTQTLWRLPESFSWKEVDDTAESIRYFHTPIVAPYFFECPTSDDAICKEECFYEGKNTCEEFYASHFYYGAAFYHIIERDFRTTYISDEVEKLLYSMQENYAIEKKCALMGVTPPWATPAPNTL